MILDGEPGSVVKNQNTDQGKYINDVLILDSEILMVSDLFCENFGLLF